MPEQRKNKPTYFLYGDAVADDRERLLSLPTAIVLEVKRSIAKVGEAAR